MEFLLAAFGNLLAVALDILRLRLFVKLRGDMSERAVSLAFGSGPVHAVWDRKADVLAYNSGRSRVTVNGLGWMASDGAVLPAHLQEPVTLDHGDPEAVAGLPIGDVLQFHDSHGGVTRVWAVLAGEARRRTARTPRDFEARMREYASRPSSETR